MKQEPKKHHYIPQFILCYNRKRRTRNAFRACGYGYKRNRNGSCRESASPRISIIELHSLIAVNKICFRFKLINSMSKKCD